MRHARLWLSLTVSLLLIAGITGAWAHHHQALRNLHLPQTRTATLLLPGDGGNWLSLRSMTLTFDQPHVATHSLTAHVTTAGQVHWTQLHPVKANNPVIPVLFADNTHPQRESKQLGTVLTQLRQRYHITRVNLVGHSSGGTIALDYLHDTPTNAIQVRHLVCIGADFPHMSPLTHRYPHLRVLNIAGQIGAVTNDGEVPLKDAQQLASLVRGRVHSYRFTQIHGAIWQSEHSLLHESGAVDQAIATFLYPPS
ncbi:alpha/beta fold hydrolase [Levilactobacillus suantsaii]|uniref:Alpha/beta hydrolase n=1 Tax=Levilactobacillus suantsaii TaxID=2292255 RepID=A0A4Q0VI38_9LACO|nr:alpha/beta fold hydrolase [Levilactobacillus suantsaii]QMU08139.1 alpha/beta hydrolase [Levilactobacillus suantsaii]RXI79051.1 alpha/beta hydrolase [Levilactobacillus suantsaii]